MALWPENAVVVGESPRSLNGTEALQTGVHSAMTKTLAAKNMRGCGAYKFRPSVRERGEHRVYCQHILGLRLLW
jgi:hypothetical protein